MARETKVGLIVGLGLILFVGMMVSEYFVDSPDQQDWVGTELSNFNANTTNQTPALLGREPVTPEASADPAEMAAVALEQAERRDGVPPAYRRVDPEPIGDPPFREMAGQRAAVDGGDTPIARRVLPPNDELIGYRGVDDRGLAQGHQISPERIGPGIDGLGEIARVEIPEPTLELADQTRQLRHTVKNGETLTSIARRHYEGDGNMWRSIRDANPGKVGPNGEVLEGVELVIPRRSVEAQDPAAGLSGRSAGGEDQRPTRRRVRLITVKEGQTLSEIAAEHLGSGRDWPQIMAVNSDVLEKPEQLRAGMTLRIPADDEAEVIEQAEEALRRESPRSERAERAQAPSDGRTYTVKSGDSLSLIAGRLLGDMERFTEIYEANRDRLKSPDDIKVGMKLRIPAR